MSAQSLFEPDSVFHFQARQHLPVYNSSNSCVALMNSENTATDQYPFTNIQDCFTRTGEIRTNY